MRYLSLCLALLFLITTPVFANWQKISEADYIWGPFKIYNLSLFTETGEYQVGTRPLMLTLTYAKPVDGRDFAISLARSWSNLGITLENQDELVDRLRKILPNIKKNDKLSYIALSDKGYFVLNDTVIPEEFNQAFNDAVVSVWLDPRVEIGRKLLEGQKLKLDTVIVQMPKPEAVIPSETSSSPSAADEAKQAVDNEQNRANTPPATEQQSSEDNKKPAPSPSTEENQEIEISPPADPVPAWQDPTS